MNITAIIITMKSGLKFGNISFLSPSRRNLERRTFLEGVDEGFVEIGCFLWICQFTEEVSVLL